MGHWILIFLKKCIAAGSVLALLQFLIYNVALSEDSRSLNTDTSPQKQVTISPPSRGLDGKWWTEGYMECTGAYPSLSLNTENMIIENGKFYAKYNSKLSPVEIYGNVDGMGKIGKLFIKFTAGNLAGSTARASVKGSITVSGSSIFFKVAAPYMLINCSGQLTLKPIFDDVFAGDFDDGGASILSDMQQSTSKITEAEPEHIRKEEEARQQAKTDRLEKERLAAELAALKKKEEARKLAEAERIRKEEEARKQAEADRLEKERLVAKLAVLKKKEEARKLAKAERIRKEEEARQQAEADRLEKVRLAAELAALNKKEEARKLGAATSDTAAHFVALKNANVRERPDVKSPRVAMLSKGSEVMALGKVTDNNWYLISRDGKELGYVFRSFLAEAESVAPLAPVAKNPDAVAVIIGNKNYASAHYSVAYAHNDADAIRNFVEKRLGYRDGNIIDLRDATSGQFNAVFGTEKNHKGKLFDWVRADKSDVIFYYSGHGVPGIEDRRGYLLPVDGDPDRARLTGYPLELLLDNLAKIPARSITVYLDACFSGGSHRGMLVRSASPILVTTPKDVEGSQRMVVLTAASGDQLASWDEDKKHGLFTWHLLEALSGTADRGSYGNGNGEVVVSEVKKYLDAEMTYQARRRYGRKQNVWISGEMERVLVQLGSQQN